MSDTFLGQRISVCISTMANSRKFICHFCEKSFVRKFNLEIHIKTQHKITVTKIICPLWPRCRKVHKNDGRFSSLSNLRAHVRKHHPTRLIDETQLKTIEVPANATNFRHCANYSTESTDTDDNDDTSQDHSNTDDEHSDEHSDHDGNESNEQAINQGAEQVDFQTRQTRNIVETDNGVISDAQDNNSIDHLDTEFAVGRVNNNDNDSDSSQDECISKSSSDSSDEVANFFMDYAAEINVCRDNRAQAGDEDIADATDDGTSTAEMRESTIEYQNPELESYSIAGELTLAVDSSPHEYISGSVDSNDSDDTGAFFAECADRINEIFDEETEQMDFCDENHVEPGDEAIADAYDEISTAGIDDSDDIGAFFTECADDIHEILYEEAEEMDFYVDDHDDPTWLYYC